MNLVWQSLDTLLVLLLVLGSALYAVYNLGSVRIKRYMLEWLVRCFGLRLYSWLSPRVSGCSQCSGDLQAERTVKRLKQAAKRQKHPARHTQA